jgi:hypothetical protein
MSWRGAESIVGANLTPDDLEALSQINRRYMQSDRGTANRKLKTREPFLHFVAIDPKTKNLHTPSYLSYKRKETMQLAH